MTSITQTIDNYIGGISQQPDEKKLPGQLVKAKNVLPDVVEGLKKRPGSNLIGSLSDGSLNSSTNGKWFHYYRDEDEQYVGQISQTGTVRMWDKDGNEKTVHLQANPRVKETAYVVGDLISHQAANTEARIYKCTTAGTTSSNETTEPGNSTGNGITDGTAKWDFVSSVASSTSSGVISKLTNYITHTADADLQTLTLNDYTYITNRTKVTAMKALESGVYNGEDNKNDARNPEAFVELKKVSYASQYALNIYDDVNNTDTLTTATRIKIEKTDTDETDTCPHVDTEVINIKGFWTVDGTSYNSRQLEDNAGISFSTTNENQILYTLRKEKFPLNLSHKYNEDNWEPGKRGEQGAIGGGTHQNSDEYFIQNTEAAGLSNGVHQEGMKYNRYYKIRNVDTGEQLISAQCTGSSENTGSNNSVITDVVNALKAGTAHSNLNTTTTGNGATSTNYSQANGTLLSTSKAYADMPFTLEADTANTQIVLTYKALDQTNHTTAGKWLLTRCNSPTPTAIPTTGGNTVSLGDTTHGDYGNSGSGTDWNEAGRDRPTQYDDGAPDNYRASPYSVALSATANQTIDRDTSKGKDLYFRLTTTGQSVATGDSDDITYKCRYTTTYDLFHGGSGWALNDELTMSMKTGSSYKITIEDISTSIVQANRGLIRPQPTSFDTKTVVTAESILGDLRAGIDADDGANFSAVTQIGNGLHITRSSGTFNINTPSPSLLNVFTNEIQDIADLPSQCVDGFRVKIRNSEANEDDYYVRFIADNGRNGTGVWEEAPEPGRTLTFNEEVMPIQLIRNADKTFLLKHVDWQMCIAGNTTTVPEPSFIGKTINKMLFWRNRMVLLSDENVIMSQPGEFFNFWPKSSITYTASDAIDISVSSEFPAIIYDGALTNSGLLLFSKNQQYLLTTDSDVLSPQTAKINTISTYNFNFNTNPISLGTTTAFLDNAGKFSRLWEMANVLREGEPVVVDQTKIVSKLFNKDLNLITNSRENSIIFFTKKGSSTIYGYKYFSSSEKRLQQSWFTWELAGTIQHIAVLDDALFIVLRNNSKDALVKIPIKIDDDTHTSVDDKGTTDTSDDVTYRIHLDNTKKLTLPVPITTSSFNIGATGSNKTYGVTVADNSIYTLGDLHYLTFSDNSLSSLNGWYSVIWLTGSDNVTFVRDNNAAVNANPPGTITVSQYESTSDVTKFLVPHGYEFANLRAYVISGENEGQVLEPTVGNSQSIPAYSGGVDVSFTASYATVSGDYTCKNNDTTSPLHESFVLGYNYDMEIQFPTIY